MKVAKTSVSLFLLFLLLGFIEINFNSCQKEIIKDTVIIRDTIHVVDSSTCNCYDLKDGLVAYYNFNGGNLNDSSGNNNNIVFNSAVKTADRFGKANNAYLFDGTGNSYMKVNNSASLNPSSEITLMAIIKVDKFYGATCHGNQILQKGTGDARPGVYGMRISDNNCGGTVDTTKERWIGYFGDNATNGSSTVAGALDTAGYVNTGKWMTLVMTYDGKESKAYLNGKLRATYKGSAVFNPSVDNLYIGRMEDTQYSYPFSGTIDEIRVYKKALCEGAVKQLSSQTN